MTSDIKVIKISDPKKLSQAFKIREKVFVEEQKVPKEEEIDEFEDISHHFIASYRSVPCAAARWRITSVGVKLERFAVLPEYRKKGLGSALVKAVIDDIEKTPQTSGKIKYLHAQLGAVPLYQKFGFIKQGDMFEECAILHYKMVLD
ncbi:GNAT family N-acetyltransferase [soil metagenome]